MTEEELARTCAQAAERAKKYRAKKKAEKASTTQAKAQKQPKTRQAKEDQRKKWREQKANQRSKWDGHKLRWHRKKSLAYYYLNKVSLECLDRLCESCGVEKGIRALGMPNDDERRIKWKCWEMVEKETGKRRELLMKEGTLKELMERLREDLKTLPKHLHTFRWQFRQFKELKAKLPPATALVIFDFSENYLCSYQDEVQSAHWAYRQVTVHPCCLYYACPTCGDQVTDYLVILSDDLNHDAHFVRKTTELVQTHLHEVNSDLEKMIVFSDGCSAQYKSKMPFFFLAKDTGPLIVEKCYFGSRHRKRPCDSCGGVVKRLASKDVANGLVIIQSAATMYDHMNKHHLMPKARLSGCSHTKRSFVLIDQVNRTVESSRLKTVACTQKLHQIKRVDSNTLLKRNLACFCSGCQDGGSCENTQYVLPWEPVHIPSLMDFTVSRLKDIADRNSFFAEIQKELVSLNTESFDTFALLCHSVSKLMEERFPIATFQRFVEEEQCQVDSKAILLRPSLMQESCLPIVVAADGNCLPRALSFLVFGNEDRHVEMGCRISIALACNLDIFSDSTIWSLEKDPSDVLEFLCQVSQFIQYRDMQDILQKEAMQTIKDASFLGLWQILAASFVLQAPLQSLYPEKGWKIYGQFCNRLVCPPNACSGDEVGLEIMWSSLRSDMPDEHWVPNHFVPVLSVTRPKAVEIVPVPVPDLLSEDVQSFPNPDSTFQLAKVEPTVNSFYKINWGGSLFVAQVVEISSSDASACIRFMEEKNYVLLAIKG